MCPYCAVGCGQKVYVQDGQVTQIEGDPASPISRGRLCPKGSGQQAAGHLAEPGQTKVRYRRPHGTEWEDLDLDTAMDMIADRVIETRTALLGVGATRTAPYPPHPGHRAASEERPSTTRRTTS